MRKCDGCGEPLKGEGHEVYNENRALQRGILYCDECTFGEIEDDEEKIEPQSIVGTHKGIDFTFVPMPQFNEPKNGR